MFFFKFKKKISDSDNVGKSLIKRAPWRFYEVVIDA